MIEDDECRDVVAALLDVTHQIRPPVSLRAIADEMQVRLRLETDMHPALDGMLLIVNSEPTVHVRADMPETRQRFTIGHEFGEYVLHYLPNHDTADWYLHRVNEMMYDIAANRESNQFAAEVCMPTAWLRDDWARCPHFDVIRGRYRASRRALHIRLHELGLCPCPATYERQVFEDAALYA